jgi:hypothetical protein
VVLFSPQALGVDCPHIPSKSIRFGWSWDSALWLSVGPRQSEMASLSAL